MAIQRVAFQFGDRWYRFSINPEEYKETFPQRSTVVKTKSRVMVQDFQRDIGNISMSGTTGYANGRGAQRIRAMKDYLKDYSNQGGEGFSPPEDFYFHNFTNGQSFVVHIAPEGVSFTQSIESPLIHRYSIEFNILRYATEPDESGILEPEIGNGNPSINPDQPSIDEDGNITLPINPTPELNPQDPLSSSYQLGSNSLSNSIGYE